MNDDPIALHELCKHLTDDNNIRQKLHDGYSYQLSKPNLKLYKGTKIDNKAKPKKTKFSQSEQEYITIEVITVKADEFYSWVVERLGKKKLPEAIRGNIPKKYTHHYIGAVPLTITPTMPKARVSQIYLNPTPDQRYIMQLDRLLDESLERVSFLEDENCELKNRLAKSEKELAEAKPKAEKWDNWIKKKGRH